MNDDIANKLFIMNDVTVERLFALGSDVFLLYAFYYKTAKWQKTNEIWATNEYVTQKLGWGLKKVREIKKILIDNGFISQEKQRENGSITAWTIRLKYIQNEPTRAKTPPVAEMTENFKNPTPAKTPPVAKEPVYIYNNKISDDGLTVITEKEIIKERDDSLSNPDYYSAETFDLNQGNDVNFSSGSASIKDEMADCEPQTSDGGDPEIRSSLNEFVEKWNQKLCKDNKFAKKIIILSTVRKKSLRARLQETQKIRDNLAPNKNLLEFLFDDIVIPRIKQSPFLQGKVQPNTGYRKFEFNLEFFCRPSNFEKLINGFYKN